MASGHLTVPHKQAEHMAAPTSSAFKSNKSLPTGGRPHMAKSSSSEPHRQSVRNRHHSGLLILLRMLYDRQLAWWRNYDSFDLFNESNPIVANQTYLGIMESSFS